MTQFSSGKRDRLITSPRRTGACGCVGCREEKAPRNRRPLTNPANRILDEFRRTEPRYRIENAAHYVDYIVNGDVYAWRLIPLVEKEHARRVLTRLANLS